ncbi:hypothetical protein [Amycolatopsis cihanbeyliensis]|uniref:hypothetical protein n=1 Tax=Amycolatopsis cihanbeyliensis TaxID=1128664 RepID=UPI00115301A8|nr:hypothetical protein [Amycolatopsis cihanbeyliensis]
MRVELVRGRTGRQHLDPPAQHVGPRGDSATESGTAVLVAADERASAVERRLAGAFTEQVRTTLRAPLARCSGVLTS